MTTNIMPTKIFSYIIISGSFALIFAGCATAPEPVSTTNSNSNSETSGDSLGLMIACPEGMQVFSDDIVYFCYPDTLEVDVDNNNYFIFDPAEDEILIRELALKQYTTPTLQEHLIATYVNPETADKDVTCEFLINDVANGRMHTIIGYPSGNPAGQDLESVNVCRDTNAYANALEELPAEDFFEPTVSNGYYLIINGEQDVLFGEYNADFLDSISLSAGVIK